MTLRVSKSDFQWLHLRNLAVRWGLLTSAGPVLFLLLHMLYPQGSSLWVIVGLATLMSAGIGLGFRWPVAGNLLASFALLSVAVLFAVRLENAPGVLLVCLLMLTLALVWLWMDSPYSSQDLDEERIARYRQALMASILRSTSLGGLLVWVFADWVKLATSIPTRAVSIMALVVPIGLALHARRFRSVWRAPFGGVLMLMGIGLCGAFAVWGADSLVLMRGLAFAVFWVFVFVKPQSIVPAWRETDLWAQLFRQPGRVLIVSFVGVCFLGGLLLVLPVCASDKPIGFLDAFFTSVSATCVTGLIVLDTPMDFSFVGQAVILLLIQAGGLGIMTFYAAAAVLFRLRLRLQEERAVVELVGGEGRAGLAAALKTMLWVTVVAEGLGAICLGGAFWVLGDGPLQAIWRGVFTSVSAYCNAGFALQTDSLIPYQHIPFVLHLVALLIIVGGLGPPVILGLMQIRSGTRLPLHARLVVISTLVLLVVPTGLIAAFEWSNTLDGLSFGNRLSNAWFQSVTTRTAGFNAIDLTAAHSETLMLTNILMFIGGSPGSTAGGIKTTTMALLLLAVGATLRGRRDVTAFGWRIPRRSIYKSITVFLLAALGIMVVLIALLVTQSLPFQTALFEVVSAFGTVGLSIGGTTHLDGVGKILIIVCMFAGRVGTLTLLLLLSDRDRSVWQMPERDVMVG